MPSMDLNTIIQILEIFDYLSANRQGTEIKSLGLGLGRPYHFLV